MSAATKTTVIEVRSGETRLDALSCGGKGGTPPTGSTRTLYFDQGEEDFVRARDGAFARS